MKRFHVILAIFSILTISLFITNCKKAPHKKKKKQQKQEQVEQINYPKVEELSFRVIRKIPHIGKNYTQGFEIYNGFLYESTGMYNESSVKKIDLSTGEVLASRNIPEYFVEGLTILDDVAMILSWKSGKTRAFNPDDLSDKNISFSYKTEGWGFCNDGEYYIMSDGSDKLYYRDPFTFKIIKSIAVKIEGNPIYNINELEYVDGKIYANVYTFNYIYVIDPKTGYVTARINAGQLSCSQMKIQDQEAVLNGIAYNKESNTFYLTGKRCPHIYEVVIE